MTRIPAFCLALVSLAVWSDAAEYARPELLVEPVELAERLRDVGDERPVVLHATSSRQGLPGAVWIDVRDWKSAFGDGADAAGWSERIGALGIGPETRVVVYDEGSVTNAARVWWILRYWGVDAALLNGGLRAWAADERPLVGEDGFAKPEPAGFVATPQPDRLRTTEEMLALVSGGAERILDTRSDREVGSLGKLSDETEHCEWLRLLDPRTSRFLPADELAATLDLDGEGDARPVVTYCRSGGRASVTAFALELMGVERVANYYGSWNAWERRAEGAP